MVIESRLKQPLKALLPIVSTEYGRDNERSPEQFMKAHFPIDVTEVGMVICCNKVQPQNA